MNLNKLYENIGSDYQKVLERFCQREDMVLKFVTLFPSDPNFEKLKEAINGDNYTEMESSAHALKGLSANLGFNRLQDACADVVLCIRHKKLESLQENIQKLNLEYETITNEIKKLVR